MDAVYVCRGALFSPGSKGTFQSECEIKSAGGGDKKGTLTLVG